MLFSLFIFHHLLSSLSPFLYLSLSHWSTHTLLFIHLVKASILFFFPLSYPLCITTKQTVQASGDDSKKVCVDRQPVFGLSLMVAGVHTNALMHSLTLFSCLVFPSMTGNPGSQLRYDVQRLISWSGFLFFISLVFFCLSITFALASIALHWIQKNSNLASEKVKSVGQRVNRRMAAICTLHDSFSSYLLPLYDILLLFFVFYQAAFSAAVLVSGSPESGPIFSLPLSLLA